MMMTSSTKSSFYDPAVAKQPSVAVEATTTISIIHDETDAIDERDDGSGGTATAAEEPRIKDISENRSQVVSSFMGGPKLSSSFASASANNSEVIVAGDNNNKAIAPPVDKNKRKILKLTMNMSGKMTKTKFKFKFKKGEQKNQDKPGSGSPPSPALRPSRMSTIKNKLLFKMGSMTLRLSTLFMKKTIFTIDYKGGFNINFESTYEDIQALLPGHLEPVKMKILDNETEGKYLFSLYCADLDLKGSPYDIGRADAFTYVRDSDGKLALCFISAFVNMPQNLGGISKSIFNSINNFFGMDPYDYSIGYQHYFAEEIKIADNEFLMTVKDASIRVSGVEKNIHSTGNLFHRDFICANSQIYRGVNGARNVNFFNQDFIDAQVTAWLPEAVSLAGDLTQIHVLCNPKQLVSVQHYHNNGIRWYFENS
jgi:hypothetical protein